MEQDFGFSGRYNLFVSRKIFVYACKNAKFNKILTIFWPTFVTQTQAAFACMTEFYNHSKTFWDQPFYSASFDNEHQVYSVYKRYKQLMEWYFLVSTTN